jgi:hypothetical protein
MKRLALVILATVGAWTVQGQPKAPIASNPVVELKGTIAKVQAAAGQGMPFIELQAGGKTSKVFLGSMRYLMEQNFSPKAGETAEIKGYRVNDEIVAISVAVGGGKTLKLRDESGFPVWTGGRRGNRGGAGWRGKQAEKQ